MTFIIRTIGTLDANLLALGSFEKYQQKMKAPVIMK